MILLFKPPYMAEVEKLKCIDEDGRLKMRSWEAEALILEYLEHQQAS